MKYPLVTLCGSKSYANPWVQPCIDSWKKITNADPDGFHLLSDGKLNDTDAQKFRDMGFSIFGKEHADFVSGELAKYPTLKKMRENELMWRKLLDPMIHLRSYDHVIILDTDILVKDQVTLPDTDFDIAYMSDDVPAYVGNWRMVWEQRMVPALNAGFIVAKPSIVDLDYLEFLTKKYIAGRCKNTWFSEQTAWACIAGRANTRLLLNGEKARVLTGMVKRPLNDIVKNRYKYHVGKQMIEEFGQFKHLLQDCSIMHFPNAKKCIMDCLSYLDSVPDKINITLDGYSENTMNVAEKMVISLKLFLKEY